MSAMIDLAIEYTYLEDESFGGSPFDEKVFRLVGGPFFVGENSAFRYLRKLGPPARCFASLSQLSVVFFFTSDAASL